MDKYEFNMKVEQIRKLAAKQEFKEAASIARKMDWHKVKDWSTLATVINVQEAVGDYEEARDMAILAYNRNLGGRKLVYKLTEFFIKVKDFDNANELYDEYDKASPHDVNRFILYYDLRKAEGATDNELIEILEDYKDQEVDEKYMYVLAELYKNTSRIDECIKTCDNIVLLFQDGEYVEKAIRLKESVNGMLTSVQRKILERLEAKKEDLSHTRELEFLKQKELASLKKDDVAAVLHEDAVQSGEKNAVVENFEDDSDDDELLGDSNDEKKIADTGSVNIMETLEAEEPIVVATEDQDAAIYEEENQESVLEAVQFDNPTYNYDVDANKANSFEYELSPEGKANMEKGIDKLNMSLRELIEKAKQKNANNADRINKEEEETDRLEAMKAFDEKVDNMDIEVPVPDYDLYGTQDVQDALASNVNDLLDEDEDTDLSMESLKSAKPQVVAEPEQEVEEQIEGQLSLADWMETVREEKYGNQDTKEFSRAELERLLDKKEENSAAYEQLISEQKAQAAKDGKEFDAVEADRKAREQMILHAVKTDLIIRTGKATLKLEQAAARKKAVELAEAQRRSAEARMEADRIANQKLEEEKNKANEKIAELEKKIAELEEKAAITRVEYTFATAQIPSIAESIVNNATELVAEQAATEENPFARVAAEESRKADERQRRREEATKAVAEHNKKVESANSTPVKAKVVNPVKPAVPVEIGYDAKERKLTGELAKIFRKYREMPGLEEQLVDFFESISVEMNMVNSITGNILISGNSSSDKVDLARTIVRAINYLYPKSPKKIAKTTGESINQRGISRAMGKLMGTALIVEGAGTIQPKRINEILNCLEQETERMIVIFEDSDAEMNVLLNFNPELSTVFNHKIVLKQYTVNELVEMARRFARKRQYEVDDNALLELYLRIDKLHNVNDNLKLDDVKEVINQAILNSEKRAARKFFGGLKKRHGENGDVIFLTEADFRN